jgi:NodT family efflux transporter outer membrane factor (OMF) lipoprotein
MHKSGMNVFHQAALYLLGAIALSACTISPLQKNKELVNKSLSNATIPEQFQAAQVSGKDAAHVDDAWLKQFNDSELNALINAALKDNPSIRVIAARRLQSEALITAAGGAQYPGVGAIGNSGGKVGSSGTGLTGFYIGANWELDLWGRVRTAVAGAEQNAKAINADQDAARLSLIATLAKSVWLARSLQEQAQLAKDNAQASQKIADLTQVRENIGASSASEVAIAKVNAAQAQELALNAATARDQALRAVEVLLGRYPKAEPLKTTGLPALPQPVAPGLPADLLERRPDLIAAEAKVNSAFYLADEKRLARLPKISLTAGYGYLNSEIFTLINGASTSFGVGANVALPLFQGGTIEAQIAYQNAEAQAAMANYGKVVLAAFNDVENALSGEANWREKTAQIHLQLNEQQRVMKNTEAEFLIGRIDQRQIHQQRIKTNVTEINWRQGQVDALSQRVNLYLALGGSAE